VAIVVHADIVQTDEAVKAGGDPHALGLEAQVIDISGIGRTAFEPVVRGRHHFNDVRWRFDT
jgi:hypothetical protein